MEIKEIQELLVTLSKERGISNLRATQCSRGMLFYLVLPEDIWNVTFGDPSATKGSCFLVDVAKKIAEPHKWSVDIQQYSPEDDSSRVDSWCEADKILQGSISKEDIIALVNEASDISEKVNLVIDKQREENEKIRHEYAELVERFVAEISSPKS